MPSLAVCEGVHAHSIEAVFPKRNPHPVRWQIDIATQSNIATIAPGGEPEYDAAGELLTDLAK